jgi:tetratricopeptide (TPR) repeat protein
MRERRKSVGVSSVLIRSVLGGAGAVALGAGALGLASTYVPDHAALEAVRGGLDGLVRTLGVRGAEVEELLALPAARMGLPILGIALLAGAGLLGRRQASEASAVVQPAGAEAPAPVDRKTRRRTQKQADQLVKKGETLEAAEVLQENGLVDKAVQLFVEAENFVRAAEVLHDQNRFVESAEMYARGGRHETAGTIYAAQNDPARAAECFLKIGRMSVAGEMFEKAGDHRRAGDCFAKADFHRHAARAYVKCQEWLLAAESLEQVVIEESRRVGTGQDPKREKELRTLVLQAAKLFEQAGKTERAEKVLEQGGCFAPAAEIAFREERFARAAELFDRAGDALRAAESLQKMGEHRRAALVLGEHYRERGEEEEAAHYLEEAGELDAAGELYRKLRNFEAAARCFEQHGDPIAAAEMYRLVEDMPRAAACYEKAGRFAAAAECFAALGDARREADLLASGRQFLRAGQSYHQQGLDDEAIKALQQVESDSPDFRTASALLGEIFCSRGMLSLANKKLRHAIGQSEIGRDNIASYYRLATVCENQGELREAVELYEKILACDYHYGDVSQRLPQVREKAKLVRSSEGASQTPGIGAGGSGRYQVIAELGRGGMGIVYKAKDTVLDRVVAYKVLPDALKENPQALRNFLREAKSAAQLNHPNIVTVYDAGEQDGSYYIAMEYVDGTTLKEILRRRRVIAPGGVLHVAAQMCEALAYAHDKKIVHRDVKTANTMWTRDRKAKIMDFGLAKVIEEVRNHTTLVSGTPYYMSPEQTLGRNVDHRTDIYSLGVTLFELATGVLPFREGNVPYHHVHTPPPDPRKLNPALPDGLSTIITRCLQKDPGARFQTAREILTEIRAVRLAAAAVGAGDPGVTGGASSQQTVTKRSRA